MKIQDIIILILFIISVVVALLYIFGKSPTFEQAILILILTILFTNSSKIIRASIKLEKLDSLEKKFNTMENSFIRLANDFKEHIKRK